MSEPQASFVPTVSISYNKKQKLDISIKILENPLTIRTTTQAQAIIRGNVVVSSRQIQKARKITVHLVGTKTLHNAQQQMGSSPGISRETVVKKSLVLEESSARKTYAVGTYTLPFEFILRDVQKLPATLRVPQCSVAYKVVATATCCHGGQAEEEGRGVWATVSSALLWPFGGSSEVRAQEDLVVIRYPVVEDPLEYVARIAPVVKMGMLGALDDDDMVPRFCVQMDRDTTAPGETLGFALRVYVPKRKTASNKQSSFSGGTDSAVDTQGEPSTSRAGDDRVAVESSSGDSSSPRATPQVPYVGNAVDAYKVKCKLVQKVRYVTDHDLVADTDDQVYMFWTKRVVLKELVASELDLGMAASKSVGIRWELQIPTDIQCSLDTEDVQVRYDVFVDFYPLKIVAAGLGRRLSFRGIARRSPRKSVWCVLPLNVLPVSVSALVANPPEYRPQPA